MAEYIECEALLAKLKPDEPGDDRAAVLLCDVRKILREFAMMIPAADVVEVKHGRWEYDFALDGSNFYKCSLCGRQEVLLEKEDIAEWCPYCHCGARMDGE